MATYILLWIALSLSLTNSVTNFTFGDDDLIIWLYTSSIVRVSHLPSSVYERPTMISSRMVEYIPSYNVEYQKSQNGNMITITTSDISIRVNNATKSVSFYDKENKNEILSESQSTFTPDTDPVLKKPMYDIRQEWTFENSNTAIFGFGSYQNGFINYRDQTIRCVQFNTEICVPMMITNNQYGIFWDNNGVTTMNSNNKEINNWTVQKDASWYNMTNTFKTTDGKGYYSFFIDFNNIYDFGDYGGNFYWQLSYSFDGTNYIDYDTFGIGYVEMPSSFSVPKIQFNDSETVYLMLRVNQSSKPPTVYYRFESNSFDIQSLLSNYIDYYYIHSPSVDHIIAGYRLLTGGPPQLYSINTYGFWHSENAFRNQQAVLSCAQQYRDLQYPVDNIVQDYYYWGNAADWGPQWDPNKYPDPASMVKQLHAMHFKFMVSVWPRYGTNTTFYRESLKENYLINPTSWLDVYQRNAADTYYYYINQSMFTIDVDYIWADSTEPDNFPNHNRQFLANVPNDYNNKTLVNMSGNVLMNPYSKYVVKSLYEGYTKDYPNKRVFSLTRSGTGGQEKYGSAVWTGDISNEWDVLERQIAASISYAFTGNNYWANDIGGFYRNCNASDGSNNINNCYKNIDYHRLMIRWFQFGVFIPIYRVHGYGNTAPYNFGDIAGNYTLLMTNLRYRLLPYIYTLAYMVRYQNYTMQRGLIFDFANDPNQNIVLNNPNNQFMFGMSLLIAPVFNDNNMTTVYLPTNDPQTKSVWWDFWTGTSFEAQKTMELDVALDKIPIYVKGGSILVLGPIVQYSDETLWDKLEVRVYKGDNGEFVLFEDDFYTRNSVENGKFTLIKFSWNDSANQLTISDIVGEYDQMIKQRTFDVTLVAAGHGIGVNVTANPTKSVVYNGKSVTIDLQS